MWIIRTGTKYYGPFYGPTEATDYAMAVLKKKAWNFEVYQLRECGDAMDYRPDPPVGAHT
jgi:hypothetical protein